MWSINTASFQPCNLMHIYTHRSLRNETLWIQSENLTNEFCYPPRRSINYCLIIPESLSYWIWPPHCFFEHLHDHQIAFYWSTMLSHKGQPLRCSGLVESQWSITCGGMVKCLTAENRWRDFLSWHWSETVCPGLYSISVQRRIEINLWAFYYRCILFIQL